MADHKTTGNADRWHLGRTIYARRSCGDCSNGPPCRCHPGDWWSMLSDAERDAVTYYRSAVNAG